MYTITIYMPVGPVLIIMMGLLFAVILVKIAVVVLDLIPFV